ncbi:unnamed protein product [Ectocarpus fasciculatus]
MAPERPGLLARLVLGLTLPTAVLRASFYGRRGDNLAFHVDLHLLPTVQGKETVSASESVTTSRFFTHSEVRLSSLPFVILDERCLVSLSRPRPVSDLPSLRTVHSNRFLGCGAITVFIVYLNASGALHREPSRTYNVVLLRT